MLALYFRLIGARIRAQMQYRVSFLTELFSFALVTGLELLVLVLLVQRFGTVAGWSAPEIALLYGISSASLGIAEMVGRGFDAPFEQHMIRGTFDGVLMRPLGAFFQILASEFQLRRLGRTIQALTAFVVGSLVLGIAWTPDRILVVLVAILSAVIINLSLIVIGATMCFWTIRTPETLNAFTFGGDFLNSYPLSIYARPVRLIFTTLVPLGLCGYPAVLWVLGRTDMHGLPAASIWAALPISALMFAGAYRFWRFGVTRYQSTGN